MSTVIASGTWEDVTAYVAAHAAGPVLLREVTAHAGDDYHAVWLGQDGLVWHASTEHGASGWSLERETAAGALSWIRGTLALALDAIAGSWAAPADLDAADELYEVELAAARASAGTPLTPREVDGLIRQQISRARAEVARLAGLRAWHLRDAYGADRGAIARAAADLGVKAPTISGILAADARRRAQVTSRPG